MTIKRVIKQLRQVYLERGIHEALDFYLPTTPFKFSKWQLKDLHLAITHHETAWIRTRRGGKTRDLAVLAVFLALIGYKVIWRAPISSQLKQATIYFQMNPYVKKIAIASRGEVDIHFTESIDIRAITKGSSASMGCDALIFDEGGKIDLDKLMYLDYDFSRAMIAASQKEMPFIIHGTTPSIYTAIEVVVQNLPEECVSTHPYTDAPWISKQFIEDEKKKHMNDPWYIAQEYMCMFVVRGGAVFENVVTYQELGIDPPAVYTSMGIDFNGVGTNNVGHMLVRIAYDEKYIYCAPDVVFDEMDMVETYIEEGMVVEVEDQGYNAGFVNQCKFPYIAIKVDGEFRSVRLAELRKRIIVVDEKLNYGLLKNLREAVYEEKDPLIKKRTDQHYLDGLMHAIKPYQMAPVFIRVVTNLDSPRGDDPNFVEYNDFGATF